MCQLPINAEKFLILIVAFRVKGKQRKYSIETEEINLIRFIMSSPFENDFTEKNYTW
jgi:hypothetical protein